MQIKIPSDEKVKVTINDKEYLIPKNFTILEACKKIGIDIPTLCNYELISPLGACRLCVVEVEGARTLLSSCTTPVKAEMKVYTHTKRVMDSRRTILKLLIADHGNNCLTCSESTSCKLFNYANDYEIDFDPYVQIKGKERIKDNSSLCFSRDNNICIRCGKCTHICAEVQGVYAIGLRDRGADMQPGCPFDNTIIESKCINCGQCVLNCPTNALKEKIQVDEVWELINDKSKHVVAQVAPAVRVAIGEPFGMEPGSLATGKLVSALKLIGFDKVFDTQTGADLTIMEEGTEALQRIEKGENLPIMTSCCPAWVNYIYNFYPELKKYLSTAKSPQAMLGRMIKEYYAKTQGIDKKNIKVISIMPCIAKKDEILKKGNKGDVDISITTRELADMIKQAGIEFRHLKEEEFDNPLGESSGAATIFGVTGGVMEAALRTAYELKTGQKLEKLEFDQIRGLDFVKEGTIDFNGKQVRFLVCHGISNIKPFMEKLKNGKNKYDFIEVMACPGGCIGGGGQPKPTNVEIINARMKSIYLNDSANKIRRSYENKDIQKLYSTFLKEPCSDVAHKFLHLNHDDNDIVKKN